MNKNKIAIIFKCAIWILVTILLTTIALNYVLEKIESSLNFLLKGLAHHNPGIFHFIDIAILILFSAFATLAIIVLIFSLSPKKENEPAFVECQDQAKKLLERFSMLSSKKDALMITGGWGCGKTSFYKGSLRKSLQEKYHKIIEVSCFGIKSRDELINRILDECHGIEVWSIFLQNIRQFLHCSIKLKQRLIPKNTLIVLDDFERATPGLYREFLGLIDDLKIQNNCNFLILCDEDRIKSDEDYAEMAEKILVRYEFIPTTDQLKKILERNGIPAEVSSELIGLAKANQNIRSVVRMGFDFEEITHLLENHCQNNNIDWAKIKPIWLSQCGRALALIYIKNITAVRFNLKQTQLVI